MDTVKSFHEEVFWIFTFRETDTIENVKNNSLRNCVVGSSRVHAVHEIMYSRDT